MDNNSHSVSSRQRAVWIFVSILCLPTLVQSQTNHNISWKAPATGTNINIAPGDTVTWIWDDALLHTVTSTTALFDSGLLSGLGTKYKRVFPSEGGFGYLCSVHGAQSMSGTITVMEPLPVEITSFEALVDGPDVLLSWTTASESNNAGFFVQLEQESETWTDVAFVEGSGSTATPQSYTHRVSGLTPGAHRFRLRQIDLDGSTEYSDVVAVEVEIPGSHAISGLYPNPLGGESQFVARMRLTVAVSQNVRIEAFGLDGKLVAEVFGGPVQSGVTRELTINSADWPSGTYVISFRGERFEDIRMMTVVK